MEREAGGLERDEVTKKLLRDGLRRDLARTELSTGLLGLLENLVVVGRAGTRQLRVVLVQLQTLELGCLGVVLGATAWVARVGEGLWVETFASRTLLGSP